MGSSLPGRQYQPVRADPRWLWFLSFRASRLRVSARSWGERGGDELPHDARGWVGLGERRQAAWHVLSARHLVLSVGRADVLPRRLVLVGGDGNLAYTCTGGRQNDRCKCFNLRPMWRSVVSSEHLELRSGRYTGRRQSANFMRICRPRLPTRPAFSPYRRSQDRTPTTAFPSAVAPSISRVLWENGLPSPFGSN